MQETAGFITNLRTAQSSVTHVGIRPPAPTRLLRSEELVATDGCGGTHDVTRCLKLQEGLGAPRCAFRQLPAPLCQRSTRVWLKSLFSPVYRKAVGILAFVERE